MSEKLTQIFMNFVSTVMNRLETILIITETEKFGPSNFFEVKTIFLGFQIYPIRNFTV